MPPWSHVEKDRPNSAGNPFSKGTKRPQSRKEHRSDAKVLTWETRASFSSPFPSGVPGQGCPELKCVKRSYVGTAPSNTPPTARFLPQAMVIAWCPLHFALCRP